MLEVAPTAGTELPRGGVMPPPSPERDRAGGGGVGGIRPPPPGPGAPLRPVGGGGRTTFLDLTRMLPVMCGLV